MQDIKSLLLKAHSSRIKHAFSALVDIRKQFMKSSHDVKLLIEGKLVERILSLLTKRHSLEDQYKVKVTDISLSILGNLCMEDAARKVVLRVSGVPIIVALFEEVELHKLQNRVCRCLANLLLDPGSWRIICSTSVIEKIVKLLEDTDEEEFKLTCIRAIRLLGQSSSSVAKLVDNNAVSSLLKLIDSEVESLRQSALRSVHSLGSHGCTPQFSSQILASGKLPYILNLIKQGSHETFQLIIRFLEHHNVRAEFGNCGGIALFRDLFLSEESDYESWRIDLLNGLCLCCKEVVNRVKLREEKVLPIFLQSLENNRYDMIHARIISALVCFLYDELSFAVLLENQLVTILVKHLGKKFIEVDEINSEESKEEDSSMTSVKVVEEIKENKTGDGADDNVLVFTSELNLTGNSLKGVASTTEEITVRNKSAQENGTRKSIYSMDSPTYKADVKLELDEQPGAKCIQSFTPPHASVSASRRSYSPLSDSSYYSPNSESPEYSSVTSPGAESTATCSEIRYFFGSGSTENKQTSYEKSLLAGSQAPDTFHPKYPKYTGISCQLYQTTDTSTLDTKPLLIAKSSVGVLEAGDNLSPGAVSPLECSSSFEDLSSSEETQEDSEDPFIPISTAENSCIRNAAEVSSPESHKIISANPHHDLTVTSDNREMQNIDCKLNKQSDSNQVALLLVDSIEQSFQQHMKNLESSFKNTTQTTNERKYKSSTSDHSILVLLSRVSQMTDPSVHLVRLEVITCLLNYMTKMEAPLSRCPRLLSRVFRNPLCFQTVLTLGIPLLIYKKLLRKEDVPCLTRRFRNDPRMKRYHKNYSKSEFDCLDDVDRFSTSSEDSFEEEQVVKRRRLSIATEEQATPTSSKGVQWSDDSLCDAGRSGLAFLEDLSGIADSNFGRGTVDRMLHSADEIQRLNIFINMLFITWTQSSRNQYLYQRQGLDNILDVLQPSQTFSEERFFAVIAGIRCLAQIIDTRTKYQEVVKVIPQQPLSGGAFHSDLISNRTSDKVKKKYVGNNKINKEEVGNNKVNKKEVGNNGFESETCKLQCTPVDICFQIQEHKVPASRTVLCQKSSIFAAMLTGSFSEAKKTVVPLPASCKEAFECLVHHLHGCKFGSCTAIRNIFPSITNEKTAINCIELLHECDKYDVHDLLRESYQFLFEKCITPTSSFSVFKYAVLQRDEPLMKACVSSLFYDSATLEETVCLVCRCLLSEYAKVFIQTVSDIVLE